MVAKVEWHPGELYPCVGLDPLRGSSVTNLSRPAERVVAFYNQRGTAEQWIVPIRLSPIPTTSRVLPIPRVKLGLGRAAISPAMSSAS